QIGDPGVARSTLRESGAGSGYWPLRQMIFSLAHAGMGQEDRNRLTAFPKSLFKSRELGWQNKAGPCFNQHMPQSTAPLRPVRGTRRILLKSAAVAGLGSLLGGARVHAELGRLNSPPSPPTATDSDVGSLFPFINSQAVKGEFPLSFLNRQFGSLARWK